VTAGLLAAAIPVRGAARLDLHTAIGWSDHRFKDSRAGLWVRPSSGVRPEQ